MKILLAIRYFFVAVFEVLFCSKHEYVSSEPVDPEKVAAARAAIARRDCPTIGGCHEIHCPAADYPFSERPCSYDETPDRKERKVQWFRNWLREHGQS